MIQMLVAILMWVLVASLLVLRRGRTDRSITYAAVAIAIAMTFNVDAVYESVDPVLGGTNLVTFLADGLLMIGLFFLGRGIMKAGGYRPNIVRIAVGRPALVVALLGITIAFFLIDRGPTTTSFMRDLGAQPAAAAYSIIDFTYCGIVVTAMLILAARQVRLGSGSQRIPASLLLIGAASGIALCVVVLVMDVAHIVGALDLMDAVGLAYAPLSLLTFVFLCAGLAGQPAVRLIRDRVRRLQTVRLAKQLEPIWRRATALRPGLSQAAASAMSMENPEGRLHREIVEIRDTMIDPRVAFNVTGTDLDLLRKAESHLLGMSAVGTHTPGASDARGDEPKGDRA